jgi:hypothetical protein
MKVFMFLVTAAVLACCITFVRVHPSWASALTCTALIVLFLMLRPKPIPFWWFPGVTLFLMAGSVFVFSRIASLTGSSARVALVLVFFGTVKLAEAGWRRRSSSAQESHKF